MAKIIIRGNPRKVGKEHIREAVEWFINHLLKKLSPNIKIYLHIKDNFYIDNHQYGDVVPTNDNQPPRTFTIRVDAHLGYRRMIVSLAHECVHIKQFARKELSYGSGGWLWNGELHPFDKVDYWECPWEIEAIGREPGLYIKWKNLKTRLEA